MRLLRTFFGARGRRESAAESAVPSAGVASDGEGPVGERADSSHAEAEAALAGRYDALLQQILKLGREQFQTNTLLEAQSESLDELSGAWREQIAQSEQQTVEARRALSELAGQLRLSLARDLLPIADALAASIGSARDLAQRETRAACPGPERNHRDWRSRGWIFGLWRRRATAGPRPPAAAIEAWQQGILLVERRVLALLEREGVRPIAALGHPFDPERHLAVATEPAPEGTDVADGTVIGETLRGYIAGDRVLRYAEVVVARRPVSDQSSTLSPDGGRANRGGLMDE